MGSRQDPASSQPLLVVKIEELRLKNKSSSFNSPLLRIEKRPHKLTLAQNREHVD